ncbi:MAG: PTS sugar transporter subunit IIA [Deltaproteobacteria bacterium]|nr:PTS sugar transporter subunit IIA [Deltaproteobacteria bacterium]
MKLSEIIDENNILPELKSTDKKGVLEELADAMSRNEPSIEKGSLIKVLIERERLGTTGIGDGVAIPHGKMKSVKRPIISFGRSKDGVDFDSIDGQPAYLFCLLVAPDNSSGIHLQVLAKIAKILKSSALRKKLMDARNREEIYQTIIQSDEES